MRLTYTLKSPNELFAKMERERYRMFHCRNAIWKADHLYNFCITAQSMRDFFFREKGIPKKSEEPHHKKWNASPELIAVRDIANVSKHFTDDRGGALSIVPSKGTVVCFYERPDGQTTHRGEEITDVEITLEDGRKVKTYEFASAVLDFWHLELTGQSISVTRQNDNDLWGTPSP